MGESYLVSDLSTGIQSLTITYDINCRFLKMSVIKLRTVPVIPGLLGVFTNPT